MIYLDSIFNLALLVALSVVSGFIDKHLQRNTRLGILLQGALFGGASVMGMLHPFNMGSGVIFDGRSVMVSLCALFFGPWAASVAAAMTIACRIWLGGGGAITGVLVILSSVGIGLAAHFRLKPTMEIPSTGNLYLFGLAVHVPMLALMFTLPGDAGMSIVKRIGMPMLLLFPLATILIGKLLSDQIETMRNTEALRKNEEQQRNVLQQIPVGIVIHAPDTTIQFSNQAASLILGLSAEQMHGKQAIDPVWQLVREDGSTMPAEEYPVNRVLTSLQPVPGYVVGIDRPVTGDRAWSLAYACPEFGPKQKLLRIIVSFVDITERKWTENRLLESEDKYRRIVENSHELISEMNMEGRFVYISPNHKLVLGYDPEELLGTMASDMVHPDDRHILTKGYVDLLEQGRVTVIFRIRHKKGHWSWIECNRSLYKTINGELRDAIFSREITEQMQAEEAICKINDDLEQKVNERTSDLKKTIAQLEDLNRAFVGRELKMVELKERIAKLEKET